MERTLRNVAKGKQDDKGNKKVRKEREKDKKIIRAKEKELKAHKEKIESERQMNREWIVVLVVYRCSSTK